MLKNLRNIALVAHVDHGKTTLVDRLLQHCGMLSSRAAPVERALDSNDQERERGITILAKTTAIMWQGVRINIVDTPGHADFGGEVERILSMVDSVLLLVDAVEGPMPQTRFVTQKAFACGLRPIVVINKIDRDGARPHWVLDQTFDLFDRLGATDEQLDFPIVYASALHGYAALGDDVQTGDMAALLDTVITHVPPPQFDPDGPFQMQISTLDYSPYVGAIGIGRIQRGSIYTNTPITVLDRDGQKRSARVLQVLQSQGLNRVEVPSAGAGDIIAITGIDSLRVSDTLCRPDTVEALPPLAVDEPTVSMMFQINDSPFAGQDGKYLTSRQIRERLNREIIHNVALSVEDTEHLDRFLVSGRGELHLSVLIETMRREGYELSVSRPHVIMKTIDGNTCEPWEQLTVDVEESHQGRIMETLGARKGELSNILPDGKGRVRLDYTIPSRGLIGFRTEFITVTSGTGLIYHTFSHYSPVIPSEIGRHRNGVLIANGTGTSLGYALFNLQERGRLLIGPREKVYEGMIVGLHSRSNDLVVNPLKAKQLTNIRAAGSDENILLSPPIRLSLEQALEFIEEDELVELTPKHIRIRKKLLKEYERKRAARAATG
uniref:Large ribosomal subunit assembly factor BipA n=1 Tax=Candidatus Kentrum sp. TUN TaxID=2126343 RepID=A0A450ZQM8_9GAMM|nr:MAG: GTP-binding protein [Candidatus Kentron sp. TUN]